MRAPRGHGTSDTVGPFRAPEQTPWPGSDPLPLTLRPLTSLTAPARGFRAVFSSLAIPFTDYIFTLSISKMVVPAMPFTIAHLRTRTTLQRIRSRLYTCTRGPSPIRSRSTTTSRGPTKVCISPNHPLLPGPNRPWHSQSAKSSSSPPPPSISSSPNPLTPSFSFRVNFIDRRGKKSTISEHIITGERETYDYLSTISMSAPKEKLEWGVLPFAKKGSEVVAGIDYYLEENLPLAGPGPVISFDKGSVGFKHLVEESRSLKRKRSSGA